MKNPVLDAIGKMKAKRVAVVIADADDLGLGDGAQAEASDAKEESAALDVDESEIGTDAAEGDGMPTMSAEEILGRKPFSKKGAEAQEVDSDLASELYDSEAVERIGTRKPKNLMERAQLMMKEKLGK